MSTLTWEAELTHLRNILYFFSEDPAYKSEIIYSYIVNQELKLGTKITYQDNIKYLIYKTTSHLTYERNGDFRLKNDNS